MANTLETHSTRSWWDKEDGKWIHHTVVRCPGAQGQPTETTFRSGAWVSTVDLPQQEPPCPKP